MYKKKKNKQQNEENVDSKGVTDSSQGKQTKK